MTTRARTYRSPLRDAQADDTRSRILDAALGMTADGFASISIPNVARLAGVSIPTVYRYFKTKRDLLDELYTHALRRTGRSMPPPPKTIAEVRQGVIDYIGHLDSLDDLARAAMASAASDEVRAATMARRFEAFSPVVESIEPPLSKADRGRVLRLLMVLTTSSSLRMLHDHLGQSVEQAADDVDWFIKAAVAAATRRPAR